MWIITHDILEHGKNVDIRSCDYDESVKDTLIHRFRLLDGDSEVYYEGLSDDCDSENAFAPLDDFGEGNAGCTEIQYHQRGIWVTL
jgi:hypothetical protein